MLRRFFKNEYVMSMLNKGSSIVLGMLTAVFLNRFLGPELKGEYAKLMVYVTTLPLFLNLGIYQAYPYFRKKYGEDMLQKFTDLSLLQFLIYMVIAIITSFFFDSVAVKIAVLIIPVSVLLSQVNNLCLAVDVAYRSMATILNMFLGLFLTIGLYVFPWKEKSFLPAIIIVLIKDLFLTVMHTRKLPIKTAFRSFDFKLIWDILKYGFLPMLAALLIAINFKIDIIFLSAFNIDNVQIGLFSTALSIIDYMAFIPGVFNDVLYNHSSKNNPINEVVFSIKSITAVTAVLAVIVAVVAKPVLYILYGSEFVGAAPAIWILLFGRFSLVFFKLVGTLFLSDNKIKHYFLTLLLSFVINVVLNPILIPLWGICGSALASVIAEIIASILFVAFFLKEYKIPLKRLLVFEKEEIDKLKCRINQLISRKQ